MQYYTINILWIDSLLVINDNFYSINNVQFRIFRIFS